MKYIEDILEKSILDDSTDITRISNTPKYYITNVFNTADVAPFTIVKWNTQIIKFVYNLHNSNIFIASIDMNMLMVDENLDIIAASIRPTKCMKVGSEIGSIYAINNIHKMFYEYLQSFNLPGNTLKNIRLTSLLSAYYYSSSIKINRRSTLHYYVRCVEQFCTMAEYGFIDDIISTFSYQESS